MISKELFKEVLGNDYNPRFYEWAEVVDNNFCTYYDCGNYDSQGRPTGLGYEINIYELANICKKWADKNNFLVYSTSGDNSSAESYVSSLFDLAGTNNKYFRADSEPEAIFLACKWVLDNKEI